MVMSSVTVCVSLAMLAGLSDSQSLGEDDGPTEDLNILQSAQAEVGHPWVTKEFVAILGNQNRIELSLLLYVTGGVVCFWGGVWVVGAVFMVVVMAKNMCCHNEGVAEEE